MKSPVSENRALISGTSGDKTFEDESEPDLFEELLGYLKAISNPVRLEIILFIEKHPRSVKEISRHINSSYDNTKKHINKLMKAGLLRKDAGTGEETSKGSLPVWKYSVIPGGLESVIRNLNSFSNLNLNIISEKADEAMDLLSRNMPCINGGYPYLTVLGGDDDGKRFYFETCETKIGRMPESSESGASPGVVGLCSTYLSVTRADRFHALITKRDDGFYFSDLKSTNGSYINYRPVLGEQKLSDGDMIDLGKGRARARLVFHIDCMPHE